MTTGQRIAILVSAAVILAGAFVLAQGSDDDGGGEQSLTPAEQQATTEPTGGAEAPAEGEEPPAATTQAAPPPRVETIRIEGGQPAGEPETLKFESGDTIRLKFTSDTAQEIHIHGYDRYVDVPAGGSKTERFKATAEGIFEIELHSNGALLANLEVRP